MLRKSLWVILNVFIILIILISGIALASEDIAIIDDNNSSYNTILTNQAKIYIEKDYLNVEEMKDIAIRVETGINRVKEYLGVNFDYNKKPIPYFIKGGEFVSCNTNGGIFLSYVKQKQSPYIHETVHAIAKMCESTWLSEGLAVYLNDKLGGEHVFPNQGRNINRISKVLITNKQIVDVLTVNGNADPGLNLTPEGLRIRRAFYISSGSLVEYIETTYGKEKLLKIYYYHGIPKVTGKTLE